MADTDVLSESAPATNKLAEELGKLFERSRRAEVLLMGVESVLNSIRYDGDLISRRPMRLGLARRAYRVIEFRGEELERWSKDEQLLDPPSDHLWYLKGKSASERADTRYRAAARTRRLSTSRP